MKTEDGSRSHLNNDIAIIGMSCRFPGGVNSPQEFWSFLLAGGDGIVQVPPDRWDHAAYYDADKEKPNKMYVNRGGFIRDIDQFDPQFFGISPKEAPHIDPQHRWLLELAYEALENAGLKASELKGSDTAVYIGQFMHDYEQLQLDSAARKLMTSHTATGPSMTLTAARISYAFDFTGPSVTLDTACSSSLVALDMACKALRNSDSKLAIAGGVNILLRPELTMSICKASMLSPDGRCKSFDASANGYVRSEGAGLILVKKLVDAKRDGDNILAIIKETGVNQDGQTIGITVPNGESQKKLLRQTLSRSDIAPRDIQYAEAHGTGTAVGDPIEVKALGETLGDRNPAKPCVIGSVKSNIGHMEAAAGAAGLIKTVMAMNEGVIPQNIHFHTLNPAINVKALNVRIADEQLAWPDTQGGPRRAVVNSFGFGGTNANAVLEQAPLQDKPGTDQKPVVNSDTKLLLISSKTEKGLKDQADKYLKYLQSGPTANLHDICYTAAVKREHYKYRLAVRGTDNEVIAQGLQDFVAGNPGGHYLHAAAQAGLDRKIAFVFSGMGPQWAGMGRELYNTEPVFRSTMDKCSNALQGYTGWSLIDETFNTEDSERIHATYIAQPAIFAVQVSLAELLKSWDITPACVVGHSAGEVAASFVAGALDFDDAIRVIYHRSRLQHTTEGTGKILAVGITETALQPYLAGLESKISIAAINSEQALTLAGDEQALASIAEQLDEQGLFARFLNVGVPYHSPIMDQLKAPLIEVLNGIKVNEPAIPLFSTVTAQLTRDGDWGPAYWADNVREPVLFKAAIEAIANEGLDTFLEIAPHPVLSSSIEKNLNKSDRKVVTASTLKRGQDDVAMLAQTVASLHVAGVPLDWQALYPNKGLLVSLPNYAWQHAGYWWESEEVQQSRLKNLSQRGGFSESVHPLLGGRLNSPSAIWQKTLDLQELAYLADHEVEGEIVYPGAAYIEMALALANIQHKSTKITLENVEFKRAFFLDREKPTVLESKFDVEEGHFQISAVDTQTGQWRIVSEGIVSEITGSPPDHSIDLSELIGRLSLKRTKDEFYRHCHKLGLTYQEYFQPVEAAWHNETESVVEINLPSSLADSIGTYLLHPVILDGAFQSLFPTIDQGYLPVKMAEINYYQKPGNRCFCHFRTVYKDDSRIVGDLTLFDAEGTVLVEIVGGELKSTQAQSGTESAKDSILYDFHWLPLPLPLVEVEGSSAESQNGQWLIFTDSNGVGQQLAAELEKRAQTVCMIQPGETFEQIGERHFTVSTGSSNDIINIIKPYAKASRGMIYLWGLESRSGENATADDVLADCGFTTIAPMHLAQALDKVEWQHKQRVYLISQSVFRLNGDTALPRPVQGALWGFGRVFASEHPEYKISMVDLAAKVDESIVAQLADNITSHVYEQEIALRPSGRHVNRLRPISDSQLNDYTWIEAEHKGDRPFRVVKNFKSGGDSDRWALKTFLLPEPAADDVVLKVDYATVNKHGLETISRLNTTIDAGGLLQYPVGFECVGTVIGLGSNVSRLTVGDQVIAFAKEGLSSVVRANSITAIKKPEYLSPEQAASIPGTFLAAHYSLNYLARMQEGETVLIHEATADIGLAAVQLALLKKAKVYATASTEDQRAHLRTLGLAGVFDSTTFEFARQITSLSNGEGGQGIDIVLNTLTGQFVKKTLTLMSPFGRFIDLRENSAEFSAAIVEKLAARNICYQTVDNASLAGQRAKLCSELMKEIIDMFDKGLLAPLPVPVAPVDDIDTALSYWNKESRKIALAFGVSNVKVVQGRDQEVIKRGRSYLVTGGLGGLGLEIMSWLAEKGAESIVLIGRSSPSEEANRKINAVREMGVQVNTLRADVSNSSDVAKVVEIIEKGPYPLAGIIHSAGVLEDGTIMLQTQEKFNKVLAPKVKGAWNLHQHTQHINLDFFVCFSSIASIVGWAGQSNYASANAFMDTLAFHRRALGKPALTINWGPWGGSGMAASLDARDIQRMKDAGMEALSAEQGLGAMSQLLAYKVPQAGVFDLNWSLIAKQYPDPAQKTLFKDLMGENQADVTLDLTEQLKLVAADQRELILKNHIKQILADVLGVDSPEGIDSSNNIFEYGMNSLMSMDFKIRLQGMLKSKLPATLVMKYPTVNAIAKYIVENALDDKSESGSSDHEILMWDPNHPDKVADCEINGSLEHPTAMVSCWVRQQQSSHFNVGALLEIDSSKYDLGALTTTMKILLTYHDGCRVQIFTDGENFRQEIVPLRKDFAIEEYDFSDLEYEAGRAKMQETNARLHRSFSFTQPTALFSMACYRLNSDRPYRFFSIFHHYISDGMSQKTLSDDFASTYLKVLNKQPVYFPKKTFSLGDWSKRLNRFAHEEAVEQIPYWIEKVEKSRLSYLPNDYDSGRERVPEDFIATGIDITAKDYVALTEICKEQRVEIDDICIYALIKAFSKITLADSLWADINIHARMNILDDIEMPKLFGQIGELSSVLFELKPENTVIQNIRLIKEQRLQVPNGGIGLRALRYLNTDEETREIFTVQDMPKIVVNFDLISYENENQREWFGMAPEGIGKEVTKIVEKDHMHQFLIKTTHKNGGVAMSFYFWKDCFYLGTVQAIADDVLESLISIAKSVNQDNLKIEANKTEDSV